MIPKCEIRGAEIQASIDDENKYRLRCWREKMCSPYCAAFERDGKIVICKALPINSNVIGRLEK